MKQYRKKPVVIHAVQFVGTNWRECEAIDPSIITAVGNWDHSTGKPELKDAATNSCLSIRTLEGTMTAAINDWIIRGIIGELYPCKPDIFDAIYDPVIEEPAIAAESD